MLFMFSKFYFLLRIYFTQVGTEVQIYNQFNSERSDNFSELRFLIC